MFAIQTLWCTIFVQTINLLPSFSPFGTLIFVRLRGDEKVIFALDKVKFVCYLVVPPHLATAWGCEKSTTSFTMVSIRLNRQGTKNRPYYKIVVVDSHKRRDGAYIEQLGTYDPLVEGVNYKID